MQKAIENYIDIQSKLGRAFSDIGDDIDKVRIDEIAKARKRDNKKKYKEWRSLSK